MPERVIPTASLADLVRSYNVNNLPRPATSKNDYKGKINAPEEGEPELYKSELGTPVVANISFDPVTYTDPDSGKEIKTDQQTYDTVLITVNQPKMIVKTLIQGQNKGSVKEYIGLGDYVITINLIITGPNGKYPGDGVQSLCEMLDAPVTIPVVCKYLNDRGIYNIVVEDYTYNQEPGGISKQAFTINAVSDNIIDLVIQ